MWLDSLHWHVAIYKYGRESLGDKWSTSESSAQLGFLYRFTLYIYFIIIYNYDLFYRSVSSSIYWIESWKKKLEKFHKFFMRRQPLLRYYLHQLENFSFITLSTYLVIFIYLVILYLNIIQKVFKIIKSFQKKITAGNDKNEFSSIGLWIFVMKINK